MGTPSVIQIFDDGKLIAAVYQQCDGYPSSAGQELAAFAKKGNLVNGLGTTHKGYETVFNGMGCFAAALVAHLKDGPGHIYLVDPKTWAAEYTYEVRGDSFNEDAGLSFACKNERRTLFKPGDLASFTKFCAESKD